MEPRKTPSWGAPASNALKSNPESPSHSSSPTFHQGRHNNHNVNRYQRPSPYSNTNRSRNGAQDNFHNDSSPKAFQNFSSSNPFQDGAKKFSSENPFQKTFDCGKQVGPNSTPNAKSFSHSSPSPSYGPQQRFSPHTPSRNFHNRSQNFQTPSPVRFFNDSSSGNSNFSKKPYIPRNRNMRNPGGSDNIRDYVNRSMLEDPWKDLPATPMIQN